MTILALIPIRANLSHALVIHTRALALSLTGCDVQLRLCPEHGDGRPYSAHAAARNAMLDLFLTDEHTHVLWIDADVVDYPPDLATRLHALDPTGIIAPMVLIEGTNRFYDTRGFEDIDGARACYLPPYFHDDSALIPMRSVGTCYLAPAALYQAGARYDVTPHETEHYSLCGRAARVSATRDVVVYHAELPRWGERWHTDE